LTDDDDSKAAWCNVKPNKEQRTHPMRAPTYSRLVRLVHVQRVRAYDREHFNTLAVCWLDSRQGSARSPSAGSTQDRAVLSSSHTRATDEMGVGEQMSLNPPSRRTSSGQLPGGLATP
jgi:hypothetical protein